jgi:threonine synthase
LPPEPEARPRPQVWPRGFWRYGELLPIADLKGARAYDEGLTPLVPAWTDRPAPPPWLKLDYLLPTGSYKDRGSAVMINRLRELGVAALIEDSSGNAGASVATYAARNSLGCTIFAPAGASRGKLAQIAQTGARLVTVGGARERAAEAALKAAGTAYYAGHNVNPYFLAGVKTWAYEVFEQCGGVAPDDCVFPVGGGSLLVGADLGFRDLLGAALIDRLPRLWAVQAEPCAPVVKAFELGLDAPEPVEKGPTVAEGIALARPPRGVDVLAAIRRTGGGAIAVPDEDILPAAERIASLGFFVEPTSAAAWLGYERLVAAGRLVAGATIVVALTGSGLKYTDWPVEH